MKSFLLKLPKKRSSFSFEEIPLDVTHLEIRSESLSKFPSGLEKLRQITQLKCTLPALESLPEFHDISESLKDIRFKKIPLGDQVISLLDGQLNLEILEASYCQLTNIEQILNISSSLKELYIQGNQIETLPENFGEFKLLKRLNIEGNKIKELPDSFFKLENLMHLAMDNNPLNEETKQKLFEKFKTWF